MHGRIKCNIHVHQWSAVEQVGSSKNCLGKFINEEGLLLAIELKTEITSRVTNLFEVHV